MRPPDTINGWQLQYGSTMHLVVYARGKETLRLIRVGTESEDVFRAKIVRTLGER